MEAKTSQSAKWFPAELLFMKRTYRLNHEEVLASESDDDSA
jgi:hypothetical protein